MEPRISLLLLAAFVATGGARGAAAQGTAQGDSLLAVGDSAAAVAAYERAVEADPDDAEAHYRAGRLYLALGPREAGNRSRADEHFDRATSLAPDSAKYWLALAKLYRGASLVVTRMRVNGLIERARELAEAHGTADWAEIEFQSALVDWGRYEQFAHRHLFIGEARTVDPGVMTDQWDRVEEFFEHQVQPDPGDPGGGDRGAAEEHLRAALAADPRYVDAAGLLVVLMGEQDRWTEAVALGRTLVGATPDSGNAWALLGLALTRTGRWGDAQAAFDTALQRMAPHERAPFDNLGLILKTVDQARFNEMPPEQQRGLSTLYWVVSQPLFLTEVNEVRVEFLARLTYVIHRWRDPGGRFAGYESDRGSIWVRYGPPDTYASFGRGRASQIDPVTGGGDPLGSLESERNTIVWLYNDSELRFMFSMTPGFNRVTLAGDYREILRQARNVFPVRFDNVPAVREMDTILVQFAQFRGEGAASTELGIYTFMPIGRMARGVAADSLQLTTEATVRDGLMRDKSRDRRAERIRGGNSRQVEHRTFRFELEPAEYLLRAEAHIAEADRAARSTSVLNVRPYGTDSLMLSDVLVAELVAPRDSSFTRWRDFLVLPSAGRFAPDAPVSLLWEVYNLQPDSTGVARYTVDIRITVREVERRGLFARILGGIGDAVGLTSEGDDEVVLSYEREATTEPGGLQVEYLTVELEEAPEALYGIWVTVTDHLSGESVTQRRQFVVSQTPLTN